MTWTTRARGLALVAWLSACGGDDGGDSPVVLNPYDGSLFGDAGRDAGEGGVDASRDAGELDADAARDSDVDASETSIADGGGDAGDGGVVLTGPLVTITAPPSIENPIATGALTGSKVNVRCTATARTNMAAVDPTKVSVSLVDRSNNVITTVVANPAGSADTYQADVPLDAAPTGPIKLRCVALDTTVGMPNQGLAEVTTFFDGGPIITFSNVSDNSIVARGGGPGVDLNLRFKVAPALLVADDVGANVVTVKLRMNDQDVTLNPPVDGEYSFPVDFADNFFNNARPVTSVKFEVTATNQRTGAMATSRRTITLRVDGDGPAVMFTTPLPGAIVGGTVEVQALITDNLAGVGEGAANVNALILAPGTGLSYPCQLILIAADTYRCSFEAAVFGGAPDVTLTIYAKDTLGNLRTSSLTLRLDNVPPWLSLDPPNLREINTSDETSRSFDPLGASPRDGEVIGHNVRFRAFVWERSNSKTGSTEEWISGVRDDTVQFFAQGNPSVPLLIDTDDDAENLCDAVNVGSDPGASDVPFIISFGPATPGGTLPPTTPEELMTVAPVSTGTPISGEVPKPLCLSEMVYVTRHSTGAAIPVVYGQMPTSGMVGCTGNSFGIGSAGGWLCVAAAAKDAAGTEGNLGVSVPLRVCRKVQESDCGGAAIGTVLTPPASLTCTDGCVLPSTWTTWGIDRPIIQRY